MASRLFCRGEKKREQSAVNSVVSLNKSTFCEVEEKKKNIGDRLCIFAVAADVIQERGTANVLHTLSGSRFR